MPPEVIPQPGAAQPPVIPPAQPPVEPKKTAGQVPPVEPPAKQDPPGDDIADLETAKKVIADLRKENAKTRTSKNSVEERLTKFESGLKKLFGGDEEEELTPEKLQQFKTQSEEADSRAAILELAFEHGVGKEGLKYFSFLVTDEVAGLEEGEEITDERLAELAAEARGKQVSSNTSVDDPKAPGGKPPATPVGGAVSLDEFVKMSIGEKSALYSKDTALYETLVQQARGKNMLV